MVMEVSITITLGWGLMGWSLGSLLEMFHSLNWVMVIYKNILSCTLNDTHTFMIQHKNFILSTCPLRTYCTPDTILGSGDYTKKAFLGVRF